MFFKHFGEAYTSPAEKVLSSSNYDTIFPVARTLQKSDEGIKALLIGLDSNVEWPVWVVGFNARGRIDKEQLNRLTTTVSEAREYSVVLVSLHHHPMVVPEMISDTESYFLSLDEAVGRKFVSFCATGGVSAILHGHFHKYSAWSGLTPQGRGNLQIIGSPAGTVNIPNGGVEFLELREARSNGKLGLALYAQFKENGVWRESYKLFIPGR